MDITIQHYEHFEHYEYGDIIEQTCQQWPDTGSVNTVMLGRLCVKIVNWSYKVII